MSDATQEFIERLAAGECGTSLIECVILDLQILNNYRREMGKMEKVFKDTEMPFEGSEGDHEFHGIDDLEHLAEAFMEQMAFIALLKEENEKLKQLHDTSVKEEVAMLKENKKLKQDNKMLDEHSDLIGEQYNLLQKKCEELVKANEELVNEKAIYRDYLAGNYSDGRPEYIVKDIRENYCDEFCEENDWSWCGLQELFDEN